MELISFDPIESPPSAPQSDPDGKCTVFIEFQGESHQVTWYTGMDPKEALLCACDSIVDSGFTLMDSSGHLAQLDELQDKQRYFLQPGDEVKGYEKERGDRWRRVNVAVDSLEHLEAQRALQCMQRGGNMLKHTRHSLPHIRMFELTADQKNLI